MGDSDWSWWAAVLSVVSYDVSIEYSCYVNGSHVLDRVSTDNLFCNVHSVPGADIVRETASPVEDSSWTDVVSVVLGEVLGSDID